MRTAVVFAIVVFSSAAFVSADPYADSVVSSSVGTGGAAGYTDASTVLGAPERYSGEVSWGGAYAGVVSPFSAAWETNEIFSFGAGGHVTVQFYEPIRDLPGNPFGIDLLIFGNTSFVDNAWPSATTTNPAAIFGEGLAQVEVSVDGVIWVPVTPKADAMFPTLGYLDSGAYDAVAGSVPSDFQLPVDPSLTLADFEEKTYAEVLAMYNGSGGGTGIDLAETGLSEVYFVRVSNPAGKAEIDAFVAVPEPATMGMVLMGAAGLIAARRRRKKASGSRV